MYGLKNFYLTRKKPIAEVSQNLTRYRSENNFVWAIKIIKTFKLLEC